MAHQYRPFNITPALIKGTYENSMLRGLCRGFFKPPISPCTAKWFNSYNVHAIVLVLIPRKKVQDVSRKFEASDSYLHLGRSDRAMARCGGNETGLNTAHAFWHWPLVCAGIADQRLGGFYPLGLAP